MSNVPLHRVIVNVLVFKNKKVLISQRSLKEEHMPGKWTIPGGKVELTDGKEWNVLEKTCAREVFEETGVTISSQIKLISNNTFIHSAGDHVIALIFATQWESGTPQPLEDTINAKWVSQSELESFDFAPNVKVYINIGFESFETSFDQTK